MVEHQDGQVAGVAVVATPLEQREVALAGGLLRELDVSEKISIRGRANDSAFVEATDATLAAEFGAGSGLPLTPNTVTKTSTAAVFWMGPDEWLVRSTAKGMDSALKQSLSGFHAAVVDVSDYYTVLSLKSNHAMDILARSCPLDLEKAFQYTSPDTPRCAQTRIGNAAVLLDNTDATNFCIQVRWSYADYLFKLLERSALSFRTRQLSVWLVLCALVFL